MLLKFTKMHGAGNDFVVLDGVRQDIALSPEQLRLLADRHFGVGCDQILLVEKAANTRRPISATASSMPTAAKWSSAATARAASCVSCMIRNSRPSARSSVETRGGLISPRLEQDGRVTVDMGAPIFDPALIPFDGGSRRDQRTAGGRRRNAADQRAVDGQSACGASGG